MKKRAVFVHVPRTAGTSIQKFCRNKGIYVFGHDLRSQKYRPLKKFKKNYYNNSFYFTFVLTRSVLILFIEARNELFTLNNN